MKPREFWVLEAKNDLDRLCCDYEPEAENDEVFIHVREVLPDYKLTRLEAENKILRSAVEFYANEETYTWFDEEGKLPLDEDCVISILEINDDTTQIVGDVARAALESADRIRRGEG